MRVLGQFVMGALLSSAVACGGGEQKASEERFEVSFGVATDDGAPLSEVKFATGQQSFGTTNETGRLSVRLRGTEGQTIPVQVTCPTGYASPEAGTLKLTRTRGVDDTAPKPIPFDVVCTRQTREVVVVVHAENGSKLPVSVGGKPLGVTDADGNAHVLVALQRDERSLSVEMDTSQQANLKPQNPSKVFELSGRDAVLVFDQPFTVARAKRSVAKAAPPPRHVPYRVR